MRVALTSVVLLLVAACANATDVRMLDDFVATQGAPLSGRVFRMDLDVTGDGVPEIFVGAPGGHAVSWVVYTLDASSGKYRELPVELPADAPADYDAHRVAFSYDAFYFARANSLFSVFVRGGPGQGGWTHYRVTSAGFAELTEAYDTDGEERNATAWIASGRPPLYWATLEDLRNSPTPVWKNYKTNEPQPGVGNLDMLVIR